MGNWELGSQPRPAKQPMALSPVSSGANDPRRQVEGTRLSGRRRRQRVVGGGRRFVAEASRQQSGRARSNCYRKQLIGERCLCDGFLAPIVPSHPIPSHPPLPTSHLAEARQDLGSRPHGRGDRQYHVSLCLQHTIDFALAP